MRRILFIVLLMTPYFAVRGQYISIWSEPTGTTLQLDLGRLWSYNLYEHSRWGAGLRFMYPYRQDTRCFGADGYYGYGVEDRKSKWGLTLDWMRTGKHERHFYLRAAYDLAAAGSRLMEVMQLTDFSQNASFMSRRMSHTERVTVGWNKQMSSTLRINAEWHYSAEQRLYDSNGLLYPESYYLKERKTLYSYPELTLGAQWTWGLKVELMTGQTEESDNCTPLSYLRTLVQYEHCFHFSDIQLHVFSQTGYSDGFNHEVPYSRMFDLGGTWGAPLHFEHCLLTARPNEFTANTFILISLRLGTERPLWQWWSDFAQIGCNPRPFIALNTAWGHLWGQNASGERRWQGLDLQAPNMGIVEPVAGIDGLLRWGAVDWGVAVAYRLEPPTAPYRLETMKDNLALLFTASLIIK